MHLMRYRALLTMGLAVLAALFACGDQRVDFSPPSSSGRDAGPTVNWDNPIEGMNVGSVEEARRHIDFDPSVPNGLGNPRGVFVTPPDQLERRYRVIQFVFDTPDYRRVVVKQRILDISPQAWDAWAHRLPSRNGQPGTEGRFEIVTIRESLEALVVTAADGTTASIFWRLGAIEFSVRGPDLTRDEVLAIAESL